MRGLSEALYQIAITLWVGGLLAIGYIAAPVLFASLGDRQLAGMVAGKLEPLQNHERDQVADMHAVSRRIDTTI